MENEELFSILDKMSDAAKIALICTMLARYDDIIESKTKEEAITKVKGTKDAVLRIIKIASEVFNG